MSPIRRTAVLLLFAAVLASAPAWGASPRSAKADLLSPLDVLSRLWSALASAWSETGCHIDPDGCARTQPAIDEGCHIDPDGCVRPQAVIDEGCQIDPDGCARPQSEVDEGCHIDPNGRCRS